MTKKLLQDNREIESVWVNGADGIFTVGHNGITKIEIYPEYNRAGAVAWCAVYQGDAIKWRFDMAGMGVTYKDFIPVCEDNQS